MMLGDLLRTFFHVDALTTIMIVLVVFIGTVVGLFAARYMQGDAQYRQFFGFLSGLVLSVAIVSAADNLFVFLIAWGVSNLLLIRLMVHKAIWKAAANSGWLAAKTFTVGFLSLSIAFALLYYRTGHVSIQAILHSSSLSNYSAVVAMILIVVTAMSQSAIWPFHRWLISSLNSPTPVSAIMHAGLVNGGGFLLVRFSPLYFSQPKMLTIIFIFGLGTALVGTLWKLMQNDIKRMLACSTMGQMGFMFVQCGLGLFPAAVAHLCWHGLFKANLFLSSSSVVQENRFLTDYPPSFAAFLLACFCGVFGEYIFSIITHKPWLPNDTTLVLLAVVFIAATQFALKVLQDAPWRKLFIAILMSGLMCALYGFSVYMVEAILSPLSLMHPQPLNLFHYIGLFSLIILWVMMLFRERLANHKLLFKYWPMLYVKALNASQPHPSTITSYRNQYQYNRG